tara:strand:+ start:1388 stop:1729 length:342 start_codon:yes stop_codon:yes gene_type:complete
MKILCFDIDGVICNNTWGKYENALPNKEAIKKINQLYDQNFFIKLYTARFMGRNNENISKTYQTGFEFTKKQLEKWNLKYHELIMGKPSYDIIIDDKSINYSDDWINKDFSLL